MYPDQTADTDSITARLAARYVSPQPTTLHVQRFADMRAVLRNDAMHQNGEANVRIEKEDPTRLDIFSARTRA